MVLCQYDDEDMDGRLDVLCEEKKCAGLAPVMTSAATRGAAASAEAARAKKAFMTISRVVEPREVVGIVVRDGRTGAVFALTARRDWHLI